MNAAPAASRRPATTASVAPGSHTHTYALVGSPRWPRPPGAVGSEVVIDGLSGLAYAGGEQGEAVLATGDDVGQRDGIDAEQLDAQEGREFEHHADAVSYTHLRAHE